MIKGSMGDEMVAVAIGVGVVVILTIVFGCLLGTNTRGCRDTALRKCDLLFGSAQRLFGTTPKPKQTPPSTCGHVSFGQSDEHSDVREPARREPALHEPDRKADEHDAAVAALLPKAGDKPVKHNYGRVMPPKASCKQARYSLRPEILPKLSDRGKLGVVNIASAAECRIEDDRRL